MFMFSTSLSTYVDVWMSIKAKVNAVLERTIFQIRRTILQ